MQDAIVIGGGIVGAAIAYHLIHAGAKTVLFDRRDRGRATDAGAGILSPETNSRDGDDWFNLAAPAVDYYRTLIPHLEAEQDGETGYARCGQLIVAVSDDEITLFNEARRRIFGRQAARGTPAPEDLYEVSADQARQLVPPLTPIHGAIYYRHAARVDGRLLAAALLRAAQNHGLTIRETSVERLQIAEGAVQGVVVNGEIITASSVVIAGGAWSAAFSAQLGVDIPVQPQRGQIIHLSLPHTDTREWPIVSAFHHHYIVPWPGGRIVVGATRETGSGFGAYATTTGLREVLDEAQRVVTGLDEATVLEIRVGLRPFTMDLLPILGPVPGIDNIYLATGHGPTGLQLGPYSGKLVAELMLGQHIDVDLHPFRVTRFQA